MRYRPLLFASKGLASALLILLLVGLPGCVWSDPNESAREEDVSSETEEEGSPVGTVFTIYSVDGEPREELFCRSCESDHGIVYVSAHAVDDARAQTLLHCFETTIFPALSVPNLLAKDKLIILIGYLEGHTYGYTPIPMQERLPLICLNALYADDLEYALAHEYQHLCAAAACEAGRTTLSEETDELLSDMFCETLFSGYGRKSGILRAERADAAREAIKVWGDDALLYVYDLLREGYPEEEIVLTMNAR